MPDYTHRFLCQFRAYDTGWQTDCGFYDGQKKNAVAYIKQIQQTQLCEGRIYDQEKMKVIFYREEQRQ